MNQLKFKFLKIIDVILDKSLCTQEKLLQNTLQSQEAILTDINTILELNHELYRLITNSVDDQIRLIETSLIPSLEHDIKQRERILKPRVVNQNFNQVPSHPAQQIVADLYESFVQINYDQYPEKFKSIVQRDNKYLGLYSLLSDPNLPKVVINQYYRSIGKCQRILQSGPNTKQCTECVMHYPFNQQHECPMKVKPEDGSLAMPRDKRKSNMETFLLTFDRGNSFICHFGCLHQAFDMKGVLEHYIDKHTEEELKGWGLGVKLMRLCYKEIVDEEQEKMEQDRLMVRVGGQ